MSSSRKSLGIHRWRAFDTGQVGCRLHQPCSAFRLQTIRVRVLVAAMPYTTDSTTGAQVPSGTTVPASSRANIRDTLANQEARLDTAETDIEALQAELYTDSDGNIAIGSAALDDVTTGTENVCLGVNAGKLITTGTQNVCIGPDTLEACTTGFANIAIGDGALANTITTTNNIGIGDGAGAFDYAGDPNNTSDHSIYIGPSTKSGGENGADNEIVIGYSAEGAGDNTTTIGNTSTTDAVIYGRVTLNKPIRLKNYVNALQLPAANQHQYCLAYMESGAGNKKIVFSDGTDWRYMDGSTV